MKVNVCVTLKKGVLDPQGKAVADALHSLGFKEVEEARLGKFIALTLGGLSKEDALSRAKAMCEKLLANTVIEDFKIETDE